MISGAWLGSQAHGEHVGLEKSAQVVWRSPECACPRRQASLFYCLKTPLQTLFWPGGGLGVVFTSCVSAWGQSARTPTCLCGGLSCQAPKGVCICAVTKISHYCPVAHTSFETSGARSDLLNCKLGKWQDFFLSALIHGCNVMWIMRLLVFFNLKKYLTIFPQSLNGNFQCEVCVSQCEVCVSLSEARTVVGFGTQAG